MLFRSLGAELQILTHAFGKITLFFCAGAIYVAAHKTEVSQLDADGILIGRARPVWNTPHGMACAPDGRIFFTEMNPNSIVCLTPTQEES